MLPILSANPNTTMPFTQFLIINVLNASYSTMQLIQVCFPFQFITNYMFIWEYQSGIHFRFVGLNVCPHMFHKSKNIKIVLGKIVKVILPAQMCYGICYMLC